MAHEKAIRTQIASVRNTQKITRAMEMVAASKMRKAQERMQAARPYADKIRLVIAHLGHAHSEYRHPFLQPPESCRRIGLLVVSTDRGLCGGLNASLFRDCLRRMQQWQEDGQILRMSVIGNKGVSFFARLGVQIDAQATHVGDEPSLGEMLGVVKVMIDHYHEKRIDVLYIAANGFVNSMTQNPCMEQLIPVQPSLEEVRRHHWDYLYEPEARPVIDILLERYIESLVYQRVVENIACEQAARMVAMKSASDNASSLIDELQLIYNKARQAAITQELSEIVGGAAAV